MEIYRPEFPVDISMIAACFTDNGHNPLTFLANEIRPREVTQPMLLGMFAGSALDELIHGREDVATMLRNFFRVHALEFCACKGFDAERFKCDALLQVGNLKATIRSLLARYPRSQMLLEPSFVCGELGLQGRVDLMTADRRLLIEQKSGRNENIEHRLMDPKTHSRHKESHYVQLLLYYAVLQCNFRQLPVHTDIRLLYSKYQSVDGLLTVPYDEQLLTEALSFRNEVVRTIFRAATEGFGCMAERLPLPIPAMTPLERDYWYRMMTFLYRERIAASEEDEEEERYTHLRLLSREPSVADGNDTLVFAVPSDNTHTPDFRTGDSVFFYAYEAHEEPNRQHAILYRGVLTELSATTLTIHCSNGTIYDDGAKESQCFALEHASLDRTSAGARSLYAFISASADKRQLLLAQREPRRLTAVSLTRSCHPAYDDIVLRSRQASDYFLVVGPPGTGKTSMALQFLVSEFLAAEPASEAVLLTAYTNRAVDEICDMLTRHDISFLRIGNEYACDPRFRSSLIRSVAEETPRLDKLIDRIVHSRVVVGTTAAFQSCSYLLTLRPFSLAIVDEASQILEPSIVGIIAAVERFILVGDHKQLPAVVRQSEQQSEVSEKSLRAIGLENCRQSLFERLLRRERQQGRTDFIGVLHTQGRMHPDIAAFPCRQFYADEGLVPVPLAHQQEHSLESRMVFIPVRRKPAAEQESNMDEARVVIDELLNVYKDYGECFDATRSVGVIVPYRSQAALIRREISRLPVAALQQVSVDTVERYQGSQRDVIIYSFTVSSPEQLDFLTANSFEENGRMIDRKLNVVLTRARKKIILTGDPDLLQRVPLYKALIDFCSENLAVSK